MALRVLAANFLGASALLAVVLALAGLIA